MSKVKTPKKSNKISKPVSSIGGGCPQTPAFSFAHMTTNKSYTLDNFKDESIRRVTAGNILNRLIEICQKDWKHWFSLSKESGAETISYNQVSITPSGKALTPDVKLIVFRLKGHAGKNARMIGFREEACPIFYVIGFDFDFSAYDHG